MINQKKSEAFTLFELIISIIIIGIVMSSFPFIFKSTVQTSKNIIKEEVFFEEFTLLQLISTRYFDENNTKSDNYYKDLNATNGDNDSNHELFNNYASNYAGKTSRIGKSQLNNNILRSGCTDTTSAIGIDTSSGEVSGKTETYDDVDDFNGYTEEVKYITNDSSHPQIHVKVKYLDDSAVYSGNTINKNLNYGAVSQNTNIKLITVWCNLGDANITLRYPTSNIGASKFLSLEELSR